jgi:glycosyltransferase involved in cell wall biosynthesis
VLAFRPVDILLDYRPALRQRTGVGEYAHELTAALARTARAGDRIHLFTSSWTDRPDAGVLRAWPANVRVVDRRVPVRLLNWGWHRLGWPPVEWLAGPVDIAHSLHPLLMPARTARQVITIHDLDFLRHPERTSREIRRDYPDLVRSHAAKAALVVVISEDTARAVQQDLNVERDRLVVCRPGLPGWIGVPVAQPARGGDYVLFVGTLEPRKNIGALLDAWSLLVREMPDLPRLRLAGPATPEAHPWLARLQVPPLHGRVEYVGYVDDRDRRQLYERARALVLPSFHEGFGLPALEAMALGVPVIASTRGALPEVVGDAGLLVEPDDVRGLAAAIRAVLEHPEQAAAMSARGLSRAASFTWDSAARALRDSYDRIVPAAAHAHRS